MMLDEVCCEQIDPFVCDLISVRYPLFVICSLKYQMLQQRSRSHNA